MIKCPYCHKDLTNDSMYCTYCGKSIKKISEKTISDKVYKENPRKNHFASIGLILFFFALIVLDFILASIVASSGNNAVFVFQISLVFYLLSMFCGLLSIIIDYKDKKKGYRQTGSYGIAIVCILLPFYISLLNLTKVILK